MDKRLEDIGDKLGWIGLWLFIIALNSCDIASSLKVLAGR